MAYFTLFLWLTPFAFFVSLSAIVRRYMEDGFGVHAPELTTEEFLIAVRDAHDLPDRERAFAGTFLSEADRVKFAGIRPDQAQIQAALANVRAFVERTSAAIIVLLAFAFLRNKERKRS